jgi:ribonuclease J
MPIRVTHSLVDCVSLAIHTPVGVVLHTGDFKIDLSSPDGNPFDLQAFADLGKQGVLACCRTPPTWTAPALRPARRPSSRGWMRSLRAPRRSSSSACFSSSIHRIKIAMELAHKHGRKVAVIGRSLDNSTEIAQDLGYIDPPQGLIIHPRPDQDTPANKLCILISGTQGEPMSALSARRWTTTSSRRSTRATPCCSARASSPAMRRPSTA